MPRPGGLGWLTQAQAKHIFQLPSGGVSCVGVVGGGGCVVVVGVVVLVLVVVVMVAAFFCSTMRKHTEPRTGPRRRRPS